MGREAARGAAILALVVCGCAAARRPAAPLPAESPAAARFQRSYDTDGDGRPDYFTALDEKGRVVRIAYDSNHDGGPDDVVDLDRISPASARHVVLILDGVPFTLVETCYREGLLRLFHPPARLISTFPSMTDIALADELGSARPTGYEALYFDRAANRLAGGDRAYLDMKNEPWAERLDYRAGTMLDALGYLHPDWAFGEELKALEKLFGQREGDLTGYFVSTAGVGSRAGEQGLRSVLAEVNRVTEKMVRQTRGRVKFTMLADHGHTLTHCRRIDFRNFLKERGWRIAKGLDGPRQVVPIEYGLLTYASFATRDKEALAEALLGHEGVTFATYPENGSVVVRAKGGGLAFVERRGDRYSYRAAAGDPLGYGPVVEQLRAWGRLDADRFAADADWFLFTATHRYPDAPARLYRAFHGLTLNAPDVIANLNAGYCAGAASKKAWIPYMASTHGDLGRASSTTFLMSTAKPLAPRVFRTEEVPAVITGLAGRPWPARQGGP